MSSSGRRRELRGREEGAQEEREVGKRQERVERRELVRRQEGHSTCWSHSSVSAPLQVSRTLQQEKEAAAGVGRAGTDLTGHKVTLSCHLSHIPLVASIVIRHLFLGQRMCFCHFQGAVY